MSNSQCDTITFYKDKKEPSQYLTPILLLKRMLKLSLLKKSMTMQDESQFAVLLLKNLSLYLSKPKLQPQSYSLKDVCVP